MGQDAFKSKHASSVSISEVIDTGVMPQTPVAVVTVHTGVNSNYLFSG